MRTALTAALLLATPALAQTMPADTAATPSEAVSPVVEAKPVWRKVPMPAWMPSALYDDATRKRDGDVVTAWVRFSKAGKLMPKAVGETRRTSAEVDLLTKVDCKENRAAFVGRRITDRRGVVNTNETLPGNWRPTVPGSNGAFMTTALCKSD